MRHNLMRNNAQKMVSFAVNLKNDHIFNIEAVYTKCVCTLMVSMLEMN